LACTNNIWFSTFCDAAFNEFNVHGSVLLGRIMCNTYVRVKVQRDALDLYVFFISLYFAIHVSGAICTHHQEHKLRSTAVGTRDCYGGLEVDSPLEQIAAGTPSHLQHGRVLTLLQWIIHLLTHHNKHAYLLCSLCSWWWVQIASETCTAKYSEIKNTYKSKCSRWTFNRIYATLNILPLGTFCYSKFVQRNGLKTAALKLFGIDNYLLCLFIYLFMAHSTMLLVGRTI
jgi:hypothetical protein